MMDKTVHTYSLPPKRRVLAREYAKSAELTCSSSPLGVVVGGKYEAVPEAITTVVAGMTTPLTTPNSPMVSTVVSSDDQNSSAEDEHMDTGGGGSGHGHDQSDQEKRLRREIANSNERRRMQSINTGFTSLRALLPLQDGDKLSKAAILQQTSDYICALEGEKARLMSQNMHLKELMAQLKDGKLLPSQIAAETVSDPPISILLPPVKRKRHDNNNPSGDESVAVSPDNTAEVESLRAELDSIRGALDAERSRRVEAEENLKALERRLAPLRLATSAYYDHDDKVHYPVLQSCLQAPEDRANHQPVIVETIHAPSVESAVTVSPQVAAESVMSPFMSSTSRQNLETIVEAIRHLEGDTCFTDGAGKAVVDARGRYVFHRQFNNRPGVIVQT